MYFGPKQDLPPGGGYAPINFKRIPAKKLLSGVQIIAGFVTVTGVAIYLYKKTNDRIKRERVEDHGGDLATLPLLKAENDRRLLKQLRRNRDEEEKLMANKEGWVTGTLYGDSVYKTIPKDMWMPPMLEEYFAHGDPKIMKRRREFQLWV